MAVPGRRVGKKTKNEEFYRAVASLQTPQECYSFFCDVCTQTELRAMEQRFQVARLLSRGMVYSDILERTGASSATISRVARSMNDSGGGYDIVFERLDHGEL